MEEKAEIRGRTLSAQMHFVGLDTPCRRAKSLGKRILSRVDGCPYWGTSGVTAGLDLELVAPKFLDTGSHQFALDLQVYPM